MVNVGVNRCVDTKFDSCTAWVLAVAAKVKYRRNVIDFIMKGKCHSLIEDFG